MRRFGMIAMVLVGFVAGIAFVYSCGGGGSNVLAEITDVAGIETALGEINTSIQNIDTSAQKDIQSIYFSGLAQNDYIDWIVLGTGESFVITDINIPSAGVFIHAEYGGYDSRWTSSLDPNATFNSGIRFLPGETVRIFMNDNSTAAGFISGYYIR